MWVVGLLMMNNARMAVLLTDEHVCGAGKYAFCFYFSPFGIMGVPVLWQALFTSLAGR